MRHTVLGLIFVCLFSSLARGTIAIDATVSTDKGTASTTVATPAFSTSSGNELLLAFIATDYRSGANTTVKSISGGGLTWVLVVRTNVQSGSSEIWRAFTTNALTGLTVTATLSQSVASSITVMSYTGVDSSGVNGAGAIGSTGTGNANRGAPTASLTTTRDNSLVVGVGNDFDNAVARTVGPNQVLVHQYLPSTGDTYWVQRFSNTTPLSGTPVNMTDTAPTADRYNLSICEILAASSGGPTTWSISGAITPASGGNGATVTLSGAGTGSTKADASGNYSFSGLGNGSYSITPTKAGYTFTPPSQPATVNGGNVTAVNFTAQAVQTTWSISGSISPVAGGAGATVALSGAATATATADGSGNYTFAGLNNGSYTVTPNKTGYTFTPSSQAVTLNGSNAGSVNFTAQTSQPAIISVDVNTSADKSSASTTVASPLFSTRGENELLLAFIAADYKSGANTTVKSVAGGGLTWALVSRANVQSGTSEIWRAFSAGQLTNVSVTATLSQSVVSSITVMSFTGVDTSGTNGSGAIGATASGNASRGAPTASLTTTRNNSWVVGVGNDFDNALSRTAGANQALVHQYLAATGDTYWVQMQSAATPSSGTLVTINDTAPTSDRYNLSICEILPASTGGGGGGGDTTPPTVSMVSPAPGAVVSKLAVLWASASDNVAVSGVQFLIDGLPSGSQITTQPYTLTWDTSTVADGTHTVAALARDTAGLTTTSTPITIRVDNSGNSAVVGSWSSVVSIPTVAVNLILLNNNKVLFYEDGLTPTVWDYVNSTFTNVSTSADLFCSGHGVMADGRVLVVGGYGGSGNNIGIANAEIFDPSNNTWTAVPNMAYKRWYPTATTLSDGRVLVTAGWQTTNHSNAGIPEIYDPTTNKWTQLTTANNPFETYPFIYLLPDGRLIHVGGSEYATVTDILDLTTQTWSVVDPNIVDGSSPAMYLPGKIMKAGSAADSQNVGPSANTTYVLDMTSPSPAWKQTPSMAYPRSFMNLTTLPDGTVLATGGETDKDGGKIANAVYAAELWSPQTQTWTTMAAMHTPREYHSTAVLLPDGRVLVSGMGADFGNVPDETNAEFYSPPYLFKGTRPTITGAPAQMQYGTNVFVGTPDATSIASVALIRTGAVTHFFDENARFVPLSFQQASGGLTVTAPATANLAPPGYYMLFIVNNAGVPSVAPFVKLTQ